MNNQDLTPGDVSRAEALVTRIRGVSACRIALDRSGAIAEIHVIADGSKPPKLVARDVESCLKAELGVAVDYRKIGVVVVDDEPEPARPAAPTGAAPGVAGVADAAEPESGSPGETGADATGRSRASAPEGAGGREPAPGTSSRASTRGAAAHAAPTTARAGGGSAGADARADAAPADEIVELPVEEYASRFAFESVHVSATRGGVRAEVELERDGAVVFGSAESGNTAHEPWATIAEATLRAVSERLDGGVRLCLSDVRRVTLGDGEAFVVRVDLIEPRSVRALAGCAMVTGNLNQSVVFAALDAVNRVAGRLDFRTSVEYRIR